MAMAERGLLCAVDRPPPPPFPSQSHQAPRDALALHWALQPFSLSSFLQHKLHQEVGFSPEQKTGIFGFSASQQTREDGDANAGNHNRPRPPVFTMALTVRFLAVALFLGGPLAFFRALMSALPPDFPQRWHNFFEEHSRNEPLGSSQKRKMGSIIYDMHGEVIATVGADCEPCLSNLHGKSSGVPAFLWQAVVACEDRRFFQHCGIDPRGVARAALSLSSNGGGSTITQQLAKNVFLTTERTWTRKLMEMLLALILETRMSKWDILCTYLKKIYFGHGVYGIEAASDLYFGKPLSLLKVGECAMLAGLIPAPEFYSPFHDPSRGRRAQARALCRMVEVGFLDTSYAEAVLNEPLELSSRDQDENGVSLRAPYFVDEVLKELKERYGCSKVLEGGLKVYTTLDLHMQKLAEEIVKEWVVRFDSQRINFAEVAMQQVHKKLEELQTIRNIVVKKVTSKLSSNQGLSQVNASKLVEQTVAKIDNKFLTRKHTLLVSLENLKRELSVAGSARIEAAITALDPLDGSVRVMVGGRDYFESCFNRSTQAYRPPGSTFEPVVYLTALAERICLKDMFRDEGHARTANFPKKGVGEMAGDEPIGVSTLSDSCIKLCARVGVNKVCRMARLLGLEAHTEHGAMVAVGASKVTPLQLASIYSTIAAGGTYHKPFFITRVETQDGEVLKENKISQVVEVVDKHAASELRNILQATMRQEMGQIAQIRRSCAGKMGTSKGHRDVWFAGFTPDISCVVWLGYDDGSRVGGLHPGTGALHAAHMWNGFMNAAYKEQPIKYLKDQIGHKNANKFSRKALKVAKNRLKFHQKMAKSLWISRGKYGNTDGEPEWKDISGWNEATSSGRDERKSIVDWAEEHLRRAAKVCVQGSLVLEEINKLLVR